MKHLNKLISTLLMLILCSAVAVAQDDDEEEEERRYRRIGTRTSFAIDLGMNNYLQDGDFPDDNNSPYAVKPFGSWYVALNSINSTHVAGPLFIEWGGGFSWYNFKFDDPAVRLTKSPTQAVFAADPFVTDPVKSKLTASYFNLSFVPVLDFGRNEKVYWSSHGRGWDIDFGRNKHYGLRIGVGGYAGYRLGSHTKVVTNDNGDREKDKESSNYFLNNLRYGIRGQIGIGDVDLFATYDLNELFSDGNGPKLNAFTFGIILL